MTLLSRLFALIAVALLPAIAIQSYNEIDLRRSRQAEVQEQALGLAKLAAAEQQQVVEGIRQVLIALSELPAIKERDSRACSGYLSTLKGRFPAFLTFIIVDMKGQSICTTNGQSVNVADRSYFTEAMRTGHFTVGIYSIGRLTGRELIPFALPFSDEHGEFTGVIIAALNLEWLANFILQMGVPRGAALAIADRAGTYLARYPNNGKFVGRQMPGQRYMHSDHSGTITTVDLKGVERIVGYSTLQADSGELLVAVGLDKAQAFSWIERRTWQDVLLIALGATLVLLLSWFGARRFIHQPLKQLVDAANQWRLGDYAQRVHIRDKRSELSWVADAFNTMADALAARERELYEAKERAEEAANRITSIFESTNDCVMIVDREFRVSYLNARAQAHLSEERDLIGVDIWEAFSVAAAEPDVAVLLQEAVSKQQSTSFERFCARRGVWYDINAFPSGEGLAVLFRDTTEHKQAIEARRLIEEQLHQSQKMEAIGQLTGGIAHDFNNLLMVISGNLELIESAETDRDHARELAAASRKAADRGANLTAQLLAFSRRQKLTPKPVYADCLIRDFQEVIRQAAGEGCNFSLVGDDRLWPCYIDPAQLQTALLNLALNGRDAMPNGGGLLEISLRNVTLEDDAIAGVSAGCYVMISVTDTGCGMTPETLDRAFEPFFTTKEVGRGTGLGLSMVYGFVRQSGGHVTIESAVGAGTTICLYLPRSAQAPVVEPAVTPAHDTPAGSGQVLLVEDDDEVLDVTLTMLKRLGYEVVYARNGVGALRMLKNGMQPDILLSDVVMPGGVNGIELAREARRLYEGIKILLASGNAADVLAQHGAIGEFPVIGKPYLRAELARFLRRLTHES
ncbi:putative Sensor protein [Bradyrhizobium sp. STM 3843]|uniref:ATP-binding protein n=1 Tax=Bradyrhizobium sp. STM 3843 TaxID=551947 RepID=UPI000240504A|nr:ATP-binding protein [Bradyrhizobium sp. STM 3843]CCE11773.1 putative Sensor protein [Bradyrhizobium sp. STM 3843]